MKNLPSIKEVIDTHGLRAKKSLGQNFLTDLNLTRKIARFAGNLAGHTVIEVGPGPGALTRVLLESKAAKIIAIELDPRCVDALQSLRDDRLEIMQADALKVNYTALATPPAKVVANLPYNIGTPLLIQWMKMGGVFESLTVLLQKEVVDRLTATPSTKAYGRLSILAQLLCEVTPCFDIPPQAFTPPPKVTSTVVSLVPRRALPFKVDVEKLEKVTHAAFGQRRKMLRSSLKSLGGDDLLAEANITPTRRAETLSVAEFCTLANKL